jgi:excinuclease ABC subunit C
MARRRRSAKGSEARLAALREHVKEHSRDQPGVYQMIAADGEVLYVGKSKRLRTRLLSYFRCAFPAEKGARLIREAHRLEWAYEPSEFAALLRELRSIKRLRPRFNVQMKRDAHHFAFVKMTAGRAARLLVVRGASDDSAAYFGPYHGAQRIGEAVRELNDVLGLRDCVNDAQMKFADQVDLFAPVDRTPGCIRYEVGKCLGPCIAACTASEYSDRELLARAFLEGCDDSPMRILHGRMTTLSEQLEFERAAVMRDKLRRLEGLREQLTRVRVAVESLSFVYYVPGHRNDDRVYLVRRGTVRRELPAPRTPLEQELLAATVQQVFEPKERVTAQVPAHLIDELMLLAAWFRRRPTEMRRTAPPMEPLPRTAAVLC